MYQQHRNRARMTLVALVAATLAAGCDLTADVLPPRGECEINGNYEIDCSPDRDLPLKRD